MIMKFHYKDIVQGTFTRKLHLHSSIFFCTTYIPLLTLSLYYPPTLMVEGCMASWVQLLNQLTLRPSGTLLFSGLPMLIWEKNKFSLLSLGKLLITWWSEKKVVNWQKVKTALCDLTKKLLLLNFVSMHFWTEISNRSGSQIHEWILLKKIVI